MEITCKFGGSGSDCREGGCEKDWWERLDTQIGKLGWMSKSAEGTDVEKGWTTTTRNLKCFGVEKADSSLTTPKLCPEEQRPLVGDPLKKALGAPCTQNDGRVPWSAFTRQLLAGEAQR